VDVSDVLMIVMVGAFFTIATWYVRLCDRVVGRDPIDHLDHLDHLENEAATSSTVTPRSAPR
jgi:hypothetical protein